MAGHARALGQKYMGIRPEAHVEEMFRDTSFHEAKKENETHPVPINNFLNAQCTWIMAHILMDGVEADTSD